MFDNHSDAPIQFLSASTEPDKALAQLSRTLGEEIPLDGIAVGFLDSATFTTYWVRWHSPEPSPAVPCAIVHTGDEIADLLEYSTWDREGNWIRIINDPPKVVTGKRFAQHMGSSDYSLIFVRGFYDNSRRGHFMLYVKGKHAYQPEHLACVAKRQHDILLLLTVIIKDFLLCSISAVNNSAEHTHVDRMEHLDLIATSPKMREIINKLERVSQMPTTVLLSGESGVGKEMLADFIQFYSPRRKMPFIKVNCGALPPSLVDSALFGHEKGAFTGAIGQRLGCFERAHTGTLLLDEVSEMPFDAQVRLLRVLQEGTFERIGGSRAVHVNVRIIAATNRDMATLLRNGEFRADLFYRLSAYHIEIPPLRERKEDFPLLVRVLTRNIAKKLGINSPPIVTQRNIDDLETYAWRGNVRELQNAIETALINFTISGTRKEFWIAPHAVHDTPTTTSLTGGCHAHETQAWSFSETSKVPPTFDESVRDLLMRALRHCDGKIHGKNGAAILLGIKPSTLWGKLNKYGIPPKHYRQMARTR